LHRGYGVAVSCAARRAKEIMVRRE